MVHLYHAKSGLHVGDLHLVQDVEFHGLVTGSVTVPPGKRLRLHGRIGGDLVVQRDAYAAVHGSISGAVRNQGAEVTILGKAGGICPQSTAATLVNDAPKEPAAPAPVAVPITGTPVAPSQKKSRRTQR